MKKLQVKITHDDSFGLNYKAGIINVPGEPYYDELGYGHSVLDAIAELLKRNKIPEDNIESIEIVHETVDKTRRTGGGKTKWHAPEDTRHIKARIYLQVYCPSCGQIMLNRREYTECTYDECSLYGKHYELPTMELEEI